jgi:CAAX prenyl protease-like protein
LAILAASFLSRALSGGFEWLYPLRFVAAAAVLWHFRAAYRGLQWRFSWVSPVLGALVFVAWIVWARVNGPVQNPGLAAGLASLLRQGGWHGLRFALFVRSSPCPLPKNWRSVARRLMAADFDLVDLRNLSWLGMIGSSALFGMLHGGLWLAGIVAGLVYALAVRKHGRIGDGIAAHATNALLAAWVLWRGDWGLW